VTALAPQLTGPLALFGHSMGAAICLELARELRRRDGTRPAHLIVSGLPAPHLPQPPPIGDLPDDDLLDALAGRYQQVPAELRDDPEMRGLYLPILRADLKMLESHRYRADAPLDCLITAIGGREDTSCPVGALTAWQEHTSCGFSLTMVQGGHFNFNTAEERTRMVGAVTDALNRVGVS
jgi:medium-chain acyl-[acyl-carrier-protein] hydrolase